MPVRRSALVAGIPVFVLALALVLSNSYFRAAAFVIQAAGMQGLARTAASLETSTFTERALVIPWRGGQLRARLYRPVGASDRAMLLVPGVHASGVDEPRLVQFAKDLASVRHTVLTAELTDLTQYRITPRTTDMIEDAAWWLSGQKDLAPDGRIGMMGISFAGGLSIIAASRSPLRDRVEFVMSFGGHGDLPRTLRYLCTGREPRPSPDVRLGSAADPDFILAPHDYGVAVILLTLADRVVPAVQVERLRTGIRQYLWASALDGGVDKARAPAEFEAVRAFARTLPEPSARLMRYVLDRDVVHLGARLLPLVGSTGSADGLSVSKSPKPSVPVFLLHGLEDNVVPAIESEYLAADLRGHAPTRLLLSGLISNAEADRPMRTSDVLQLAGFWGDLLSR